LAGRARGALCLDFIIIPEGLLGDFLDARSEWLRMLSTDFLC
jgi:hypothetical protein